MKMIMAIVRPSAVEAIKSILNELNLPGFTIAEVQGHGRQKGHTEVYRGAEYVVDLLSKAEIKLAVPDELVDKVVTAISVAARTGRIGDGKIFVMPIAQVIRIRTGESGPDAL